MKIDRNNKFQTVRPTTKGNYLTAYWDGNDIVDYTATTEAVLPLQINASEIYREITPVEHEQYLAKQKQKSEEQKTPKMGSDGI